jgi:hypothetical protein
LTLHPKRDRPANTTMVVESPEIHFCCMPQRYSPEILA